MTLVKSEPITWMNRICDDLNPGLDTQDQENETNQNPTTSDPVDQIQLRDTDMPSPFNLVPLAPCPPIVKSSPT
jgi:hypothetical protein